jgi:hypothetical protein
MSTWWHRVELAKESSYFGWACSGILSVDVSQSVFQQEINGGHCLLPWSRVCMPVQCGGLGVLNLKYFGCALRCRWPWLRWASSPRPWTLIPLPDDRDAAQYSNGYSKMVHSPASGIQGWLVPCWKIPCLCCRDIFCVCVCCGRAMPFQWSPIAILRASSAARRKRTLSTICVCPVRKCVWYHLMRGDA